MEYTFETQQHKRIHYVIILIAYIACFYVISNIISIITLPLWLVINNVSNAQLQEFATIVANGGKSELYTKYINDVSSWTNFATYVIATAAILPISFKVLKEDFKYFGKKFKKNIIWVVAGFGIIYSAGIIGTLISEVLTINIINTGSSENQETIEQLLKSSPLNMALISIMTIVLAPILEEIVFRKAFFGIFKKKSSFTVIITSLIFASIHVVPACLIILISMISGDASFTDLYIEATYIFSYLGQGLAIGYVYYKSKGNLVPCIIIHAINNFIAIVATLLGL